MHGRENHDQQPVEIIVSSQYVKQSLFEVLFGKAGKLKRLSGEHNIAIETQLHGFNIIASTSFLYK